MLVSNLNIVCIVCVLTINVFAKKKKECFKRTSVRITVLQDMIIHI